MEKPSLPESKESNKSSSQTKSTTATNEDNLSCLKCKTTFEFTLDKGKDDYLAHLFRVHRLVIADVDDIADLREYLKYWIDKFKDHSLEEYCTTMLLDQLPDGTISKNEKYYLLSDILPQDFELRKRLHQLRLEKALAKHQFERTDREFSKECLYCRDVIHGLRSEFLEHLFTKHFLQLGKPENLVYVDELLEKVQSSLENLICLYCEKVFKDRVTLKEHMRKKGHKRINPNNHGYDRFFLVNYRNEKPKHTKSLEQTRRNATRQQQREKKEPKEHTNLDNSILSSEDSDSDWFEWDSDKLPIACLFCSKTDPDMVSLRKHMQQEHELDFEEETRSLNFYQKVKAVNYVRRQVQILRCVTCNCRCETTAKLLEHMSTEKHYSLGTRSQWDKPEFFFPTFEDDGLLCVLDDGNDNDDDESVVRIISEDSLVKINKDAEQLSLENFNLP
ncbi:zinc finger protein 277 [Episyrphus balteatus]|uniref:zinc finger protein 277 n=1 Tax=Episyrphus balteatus TaxID=286459 RepID=UPI00248573D3|nr:zinc finger protein 277 [Episyrphus balteatus]